VHHSLLIGPRRIRKRILHVPRQLLWTRPSGLFQFKTNFWNYESVIWELEYLCLHIYGLDDRGSIPGRGMRFLSSPQLSDALWGPYSLLPNGYREIFPRKWSGLGVKLTTHLHLPSGSRMLKLYLNSPHTSWWRGVYLIKYRDNFTFS
jgi:hypothetical protein